VFLKIFLFILSFSSLFFVCQIPGLINYSEEDGLTNSYTYQLRQDSNGFIWIGSDNGLFRFDGKEFKQYNKRNGLKNIDILACEPLADGEIFIFPFLNDFAYLKNGKIINSDENKELKKLVFSNSPVINPTKDSLVLCSTNDPKDIYVYQKGKVKKIPLFIKYRKDKSPTDIYSTVEFNCRAKVLYFTNGKGNIIAYDIMNKKETVCNIILDKSYLVYKKNNFLISIKKGKGVDIYTISNKYYFKKIYSFDTNDTIHQLVLDKNKRLWLCLENGGLLYFDTPLSLSNKFSSPIRLLSEYIINDVMTDADNNIWFSTRNNGVYFITEKFFRNYINFPIKNNSSYITNITSNGKSIFFGYNEAIGGIFDSDKIKNIVFEQNKKNESKGIYANKNNVFFGFTQNVFQYDILTKKKTLLKRYNLKNLVPYNNESILICASDGLTKYDFVKKKYTEFIKGERVYTALPFSEDSIFAGSFKDLYKLDISTGKKILFLEGCYFKDLKQLKPNLYIGATNLNGIFLFNNHKILKKITENEGLSTGQIKNIEVENENTFWASTNSGLSRIELKGNSVKINNFTQRDGLPSNVVAGCVIKKDTIYVGTSKGVGILSIQKLLTQQKFIHKKVTINYIVIGGKEYFDLTQKLSGQTPDNDVVFNLSFPDYTSEGKISYKYKIEGLNNNWQISNSSKIIFNSLPPGKYILKVFGLGYNRKQSYVSTDLAFEIKPAFWQTWWFKLLLMLIAIAVLVFILNLYFQRLRNKKLETAVYEKKIAELELQAIKAQINPHFIYNCLNSIQFLLYKKDYQETENYLDVFSQMIRKTLHYSEKTFMSIKEETEYLSLYLNMERLRLKKQFDYTITVSESVNENWAIPSLLIQPFVENAIKHGISDLKDRKGNIEILFEYTDSILCITIEDNGVGLINQSELLKKADSFGVKLSRKRIETFKQLFETKITLEINNLSEKTHKKGTQIKLYIHSSYEKKNTDLYR